MSSAMACTMGWQSRQELHDGVELVSFRPSGLKSFLQPETDGLALKDVPGMRASLVPGTLIAEAFPLASQLAHRVI